MPLDPWLLRPMSRQGAKTGGGQLDENRDQLGELSPVRDWKRCEAPYRGTVKRLLLTPPCLVLKS